tara:strand:- start:35 stop:208 length:174 start_codon:yes stop_codon:yes gene_type:complete
MAYEEDTYRRNDHRLNSRPLDVHRWRDHAEVKQLIDQLWDASHKVIHTMFEIGVWNS